MKLREVFEHNPPLLVAKFPRHVRLRQRGIQAELAKVKTCIIRNARSDMLVHVSAGGASREGTHWMVLLHLAPCRFDIQ